VLAQIGKPINGESHPLSNTINIEYGTPFSKAWERMKKALFQPFDIGKWFVLGFSVFLAQLLKSGDGPLGFSNPSNNKNISWPRIEHIPGQVSDWIQLHVFLAIVIFLGILVFIGIALVLIWLSSRGAFIFLDNVVHDRARIVEPWGQFKTLGNSLFFWRLGYGIVIAFLTLPLLVLTVVLVIRYSHGRTDLPGILAFITIGFIWFVVTVIAAYISLFTNSFIVPIMYRHDMHIIPAWQKFLPIFKSHFGHFILYGLFILVLVIGIGVAAILAGCLTCCIGFILLALPYINSVVLLPVHFTLRAFSLEYLSQWGSDFSVFPVKASPPDDMPPPPAPPPAGVEIIGM
jgi:hypothetical protein